MKVNCDKIQLRAAEANVPPPCVLPNKKATQRTHFPIRIQASIDFMQVYTQVEICSPIFISL